MGRLLSLLSLVTAASCLSSIAFGLHEFSDFNSGIQIFIVKQGDNLYLTCYLTGPNVTWHTPKGSVFGRNLNLTYITSDFQGYYFCSDLSTNITEPEEVNGEFISATSNLFYLEVLDFNSGIPIIPVKQGDSLYLTCHLTGPNVTWYTPNGPVLGRQLNLTHITREYQGIYSCSYLDTTTNRFYLEVLNFNSSDEIFTVNEGDNLYVTCNLTGQQITWYIPNDRQLFGRELNLTNITKEFKGIYYCSKLNTNKTEPEEGNNELSSVKTNYFYLDVLYQAKIKFVNVVQTIVQPNGTYEIHFGIEGNPAPRTTFTSLSDRKIWFNQTKEGNFTINISKMNCTNAGSYILTCENSIGEDSRTEDIFVVCVPDHVTNIHANGITTNNASIGFTTGNAFNTAQFFYIMRIMDGQLQDLHVNATDVRDDSGGMPFFVIIKNLNQSTSYNITVISGNRWGNSTVPSSFVNFETYGKPEPDPNFVVNKTFKPRLGESVSLIIHSRGNPPPSYTWLHNGKLIINSTDDNDTSIVDLKAIVVDNFGIYNLTMNNIFGTYTVDYEVLADGPPEPVSNVFVSNINFTCAHVHFTTGYNYNSTQTFIINEYIDGHLKQLKMCKDLTAGKGGEPFTCELCDLFEDTLYNITVVANNSRGESEHNPESVKFSTYGKPKPDPDHTSNTTFKPRLGNTVTLSIHVISHPPPSFVWVHNDKEISSFDTNQSSAVDLKSIEVNDFGKYQLNVSNEAGSFLRSYEILADGPPDPVANLSISTVTVSFANLSFVTGYDYNKTQTFVVMRYLKGKSTELVSVNDTQGDPGQKKFSIALHNLTMNTEYNLTVVAKNGNGSSRPSENCASFMTEGVPEPDPNVPVNNTNAPRLGQDTLFKVYAIGNPLPKFAWWHNNSPVKHTDHDNVTELEIKNVTEDDYGKYILNMQNTIGSKNYTFMIKADGPPDSVTQLSCTDVAADSVELHWKAGFDYGSSQTFQVQGSVNNKALQNVNEIQDSTGGKGGSSHSKLENLESSSQYIITLTAKNAKGEAKKSNEVSFTTQAASKGDVTTTAEYVGYVVGSVGGVVFIIALIFVVRRFCKRNPEAPYRALNDEEEITPQPHSYRYDDAANPNN